MLPYFKKFPPEIKTQIIEHLYSDKAVLVSLWTVDEDVRLFLNDKYYVLNISHPQALDWVISRTRESYHPNFPIPVSGYTGNFPKSWVYEVVPSIENSCKSDDVQLRTGSHLQDWRDSFTSWIENLIGSDDCKVLEIRVFTSPFFDTCLQCDLDFLFNPATTKLNINTIKVPIHITVVKSYFHTSLIGYRKSKGHGCGEDLHYEGLFDMADQVSISHDKWAKEIIIDSFECKNEFKSNEISRHVFLKPKPESPTKQEVSLVDYLNVKSIDIIASPNITTYEKTILDSRGENSKKLRTQILKSQEINKLEDNIIVSQDTDNQWNSLSNELTSLIQRWSPFLTLIQSVEPRLKGNYRYRVEYDDTATLHFSSVRISSFMDRRRLEFINKASCFLDKLIWDKITKKINETKIRDNQEIRAIRFRVLHPQETLDQLRR